MTVIQDGYICGVCGPVKAKLSWSDEENDVVAYCTECGAKIQRVIPKPFSIAAAMPLFSTHTRGGPGHKTDASNLVAPATPTKEAET